MKERNVINMDKKCLAAACICAATLFASTGAFAETYTSAKLNEKNIEINLTSDYGSAQYTVYLLKPNGKIPTDEKGTTTDFYKIENINAVDDSKGIFNDHTFAIQLDDNAPYGVYKAVIGGGEIDGALIDIAYASASDANAALAEIKTATAETIGGVLTKYQDKVWSIDTDKAIYKSNKSEVETSLYEMLKDDVASVQNVIDAFEKACMLTEIKNCDKDEIYLKLFLYEEYLGITYSQEVINKNAELVDVFSNLRKSEKITTEDDLAKVLRASEAVAKVNLADRDNIINTMKEYNDVLSIDFNGKFAKVDSYQVAKSLVAGKKYATAKSVLDKFNEIVEELSKGKTENVITSKPSGGGGGISNSSNTTISSGNTFYPSSDGVSSDMVASLDNEELFDDLDNAQWAVPYIKYMAENGIMSGDGNSKFRPTDTITRAEFIKVLIYALDLENAEFEQAINFDDVPSDAWYTDYVKIGSGLGITNGTSETTFSPMQQVSRQDAAVMILNAVKVAGLNLHTEIKNSDFADSEDISDYAKEAVDELVNADIISGYDDATFLPKNSLLRCETAKLIYSMLTALKE